MLNFSPDHLDRHPDVDAYGAAKARIFENQKRERLRGDQRRRSRGARAGAPRPGRGAVRSRSQARSIAAPSSRTAGSSTRRDTGERTAGAARRDSSARAASRQRRDGGGDGRRDCRRGAGGDDRGGRRVPRPRARDGAGRRRRRRALRQRLEGDQRRIGAALDRKLRSRSGADHRRTLQGRRSAAAARAADARAPRRSWRSAKRGRCCARRWRDVLPVDERRQLRRPRSRARTSWRSRQAWCCSRRRARASTCSAITRSAGEVQGGR